MGIDGLQETLGNASQKVISVIQSNPVGTAVGAAVGGAVIGGIATGVIVSSIKKKRKSKSRSSRKRSGRSRDARFKSKQKHERRYKRKRKYKIYGRKGWIHPKRKHNSKRRGKIHYARKTGQPYIILASGKAKFIKGKRRK